MPKNLDDIANYFYLETDNQLKIISLKYLETRCSYLDSIDCYLIETDKNINFYVFNGSCTLMNLYPIKQDENLDDCYYKHIGLMAEFCSKSLNNNFILEFAKEFCIFPVLERRIFEIENQIDLKKNSDELSGIANQIRDCYLYLTDYLINKNITNNPNYKNDNFTDNLSEFLNLLIPNKSSECRRNTLNVIAKKGWQFNADLVHKSSTTIFDIFISLNILKLVVSSISNLLVGNDMPFNRIKCPNCDSENYKMGKTAGTNYKFTCKDCGCKFEIEIAKLKKNI